MEYNCNPCKTHSLSDPDEYVDTAFYHGYHLQKGWLKKNTTNKNIMEFISAMTLAMDTNR